MGRVTPLVGLSPERAVTLPNGAAGVGAARALLHADADGRPLMIFVDDAQWVDGLTLSLLRLMALEGEAKLLVTVRTPADVAATLTSLRTEELCQRLDLQPLTQAETREVVEHLLGGPVVDATRARLVAATGGNPLHVRLPVEELRAQGRLRRLDDGRWGWDGLLVAGSRLTELVASHFGALDDELVELLSVVAVGEPLPLLAVERLARPEVVCRAWGRGLLQVSVGDARLVRLAHPIMGLVLQATGRMTTGVAAARLLEATASVQDAPSERLRRARWALEADRADPGVLTAGARLSVGVNGLLAVTLARAAIDAGGGLPATLALAEALVGSRSASIRTVASMDSDDRDCLPASYRLLLDLVDAGVSDEDIARRLGIPVQALPSLIAIAHAKRVPPRHPFKPEQEPSRGPHPFFGNSTAFPAPRTKGP